MLYACFVYFSTTCFHNYKYCLLEFTKDLLHHTAFFKWCKPYGDILLLTSTLFGILWTVVPFFIILYFYIYLCNGNEGKTKINYILMYACKKENDVLHYAITECVVLVTVYILNLPTNAPYVYWLLLYLR